MLPINMDSLQATKIHFMRQGSSEELCDPVLVPTVLPGPLMTDDQRAKHAAAVAASLDRATKVFKKSQCAASWLMVWSCRSYRLRRWHTLCGSHLLSRSKALAGYLTPTAPAVTMALLNIYVSITCARKSKLSAGNGSPAPTAGAQV